jgi:hypothetical protein
MNMRVIVRVNQKFPLRSRRFRKGGFRMDAANMQEGRLSMALCYTTATHSIAIR